MEPKLCLEKHFQQRQQKRAENQISDEYLLTFDFYSSWRRAEILQNCQVKDWREMGRWGESLAKLRQTSTHGSHFCNSHIDQNITRIVIESLFIVLLKWKFSYLLLWNFVELSKMLGDQRGVDSSAKWRQTTHGPHFCNNNIDPTRTQYFIWNHSFLPKTSYF